MESISTRRVTNMGLLLGVVGTQVVTIYGCHVAFTFRFVGIICGFTTRRYNTIFGDQLGSCGLYALYLGSLRGTLG